MKFYELINTVDEDDYRRFYYIDLEKAKVFAHINPNFGVFERETEDELTRGDL